MSKNMKLAARILSIVFGSLLTIHVVFAAIFSAYLVALEEHRLLNLRNFPREDWPNLIRAFSQRQKNVETLFLGSSYTWGYSWQEDVIFSAYFQNSANISVIGGTATGTIELMSAARPIKADRIVFEINASNLAQDVDAYKPDFQPADHDSYFSIFLSKPFGVKLFEMAYNQYNYHQLETEYRQPPLADDYFLKPGDINVENFRQRLTVVADIGSQISDEIYVFISPMVYADAPPFALEAYEILFDVCRSEARLKCIDTKEFEDRYNFVNISHLNIRGHEAFSKFLMSNIGLK